MDHLISESAKFHRAEYDALREEILALTHAMDLTLYVGLVSSAFSASWLLTTGQHPPAFWCAPFFVAALACLMFFQKAMNVMRLGRYIRKIEIQFADPKVGGWEGDGTPGRFWKWFMPVNLMLHLYWGVFLFATFLFGAEHVGIQLPAALSGLVTTP